MNADNAQATYDRIADALAGLVARRIVDDAYMMMADLACGSCQEGLPAHKICSA
jgi:hypothetical protein